MHYPSNQIKKQKISRDDLNSENVTLTGNTEYRFCIKNFKGKVNQGPLVCVKCNRCLYYKMFCCLILQNMTMSSYVKFSIPDHQILIANPTFLKHVIALLKSLKFLARPYSVVFFRKYTRGTRFSG